MMPLQRELRFPAGSQAVETSEDAADSLSPDWLNARRRKVLEFFALRADAGATADELAECWRESHNSVAPRITELLEVGLLTRCDGATGNPPKMKRATRSGRPAFVHRITVEGRDWLEP